MPYDLVIIGAGPAGLTAGIYARTRKLSTLIVDASEAGGQLAALYPEKGIDNYPGYIVTEAGVLSRALVSHALSMGCEIKEHERVINMENLGDGIKLLTDKGSYEGKAVILATGAGLFRPKKLGIPGEERLVGK